MTKKPKEKKQSYTLFKQGYSDTAISNKLNVTLKTIGLWRKEFNIIGIDGQTKIRALEQRLSSLEKEFKNLQNLIKIKNGKCKATLSNT